MRKYYVGQRLLWSVHDEEFPHDYPCIVTKVADDHAIAEGSGMNLWIDDATEQDFLLIRDEDDIMPVEDFNMEIREIVQRSGMSQAKFGAYLGIPRRTVEDWCRGINKCPSYVAELIEFRLKSDGIIKAED